MSCLASLGLIAATIYSLRIVQKVFLGNKNTDWKMNDLTLREKVVSASLVIAWFGWQYSQPVRCSSIKDVMAERGMNNTFPLVFTGKKFNL